MANSEEPSILEGSSEIIEQTQKIKLQGRDIEDYIIVNPSYSTLLTDVLNEAIYNLCGFELEIVDPYDFEGGSSTIAFGDGDTGFKVKNKPCYVSQRKNPNHLLVIKK